MSNFLPLLSVRKSFRTRLINSCTPSVKHNWADETEGIDGGVGKEKEKKKKRKTGIVSNPLTTNTTLLPTTHFSLRSIHIYIYKERRSTPLAKLYFPSARRNLHHLLFLPPNEPFSSSLTCQFFSLLFFLPPLRFRSLTSRSIIRAPTIRLSSFPLYHLAYVSFLSEEP